MRPENKTRKSDTSERDSGATRAQDRETKQAQSHPNEMSTRSGRPAKRTSARGFASMDASKQREIAALGGRAAHRKGTAHTWDSDEARQAGRKGGQAAHAGGNAHQWDSDEARQAGRKGGEAAHAAGNAHQWDSEEARRAGRKGGKSSRSQR